MFKIQTALQVYVACDIIRYLKYESTAQKYYQY